MAKIYVASSWRNEFQPGVVERLRNEGHEVYDFRNPPFGTGFQWSDIDPDWMNWTPDQYVAALKTEKARKGFESDFSAMRWADVCVLVLPCGRSAHLECGWMAGHGKETIILTREGQEPELMALLARHVATNMDEVVAYLKEMECL